MVRGKSAFDFLGPNDLTSLKIEHYVGTANAGGGPSIKYPLADNAVAGKRVLIVMILQILVKVSRTQKNMLANRIQKRSGQQYSSTCTHLR